MEKTKNQLRQQMHEICKIYIKVELSDTQQSKLYFHRTTFEEVLQIHVDCKRNQL